MLSYLSPTSSGNSYMKWEVYYIPQVPSCKSKRVSFLGNPQNMWKNPVWKPLASLIFSIADVFGQQVARGFHHVDGCFLHPLHMIDGRSSTKFWEIPHDSPGESRRATIFEISGTFVEVSWRFRGVFVGFSWLRIIAPKAFSHAWPVFVGFSWDFRGPTKNEISGIFVEFSWLFRGRRYPASNRKHAQAHCLGKHWREYFSELSAFPITRFSCKRTVATKFPLGFVRGRASFAFACSVAHRFLTPRMEFHSFSRIFTWP